MTYAPVALENLAAYWVAQGGVNLGIVGDAAHQSRGTSYHLGKDLLEPGAYSATTARDRAGLSNAASALDLGKLGGSFPKLRNFSAWLIAEARAGRADDIREIIYSPDGDRVLRWDRERGVASQPFQLDSTVLNNSHRTHTHISWYRDSEKRDHVDVFRPYFEVKEPVMTGFRVIGEDWIPAARPGANDAPVRLSPDRAGAIALRYPAGMKIRTVAEFSQGGDSWRVTRLADGRTGFLIRGDLEPLTPGGDPTVDKPLLAYVLRQAPAADPGAVNAVIDKAIADLQALRRTT